MLMQLLTRLCAVLRFLGEPPNRHQSTYFIGGSVCRTKGVIGSYAPEENVAVASKGQQSLRVRYSGRDYRYRVKLHYERRGKC